MRHPLPWLRLFALCALGFSAASAYDDYTQSHAFCAPGAGCDAVRASAIGQAIGWALPALGLFVYSAVFVLAMRPDAAGARVLGGRLRAAAALAVLGGLGALAFLLAQAFVIGAFCELCVGVDLSAIAAGVVGGLMLRREPGPLPEMPATRARYWALYPLVVLGPFAYGWSQPSVDAPRAIVEAQVPGKVTVVEMADFECPFCRRLHPLLKEALAGMEDKVAVRRVIVPLPFHPHALPAAQAYRCAAEAGQGEAMADHLFAAEDLRRAATMQAAVALGLDADAMSACMADDATKAAIEADRAFARAAEMRGLPTVYIGERRFEGLPPDATPALFRDAIEASMRGGVASWWPSWWTWALVLGLMALPFALSRRPRTR